MDLTRHATFFDLSAMPWEKRLAFVVETMREMSRQTDPQAMVRAYSARMRQVIPSDKNVALSRRDLPAPKYRITRSSSWDKAVNPWQQRDQLPIFDRGLLGELIYGNEPVIIDDLDAALKGDDPAASFMSGMRSLVAVPLFDQGVALNMVVLMRAEPAAFRREQLPEHVWMSNLFGRATHNLVLSEELKKAYDAVDREMQVVADIQRSLLPVTLPNVPTLDLAAHYQTSRRAGGDYYDFFPLPGGRWGVLMADVSGHGTPAAVLMAVTHSIAHTLAGPPEPPGKVLAFVNDHLTARYTAETGKFVTAFYGVYDPATRTLDYASAGHNPPRLRRAGSRQVWALDREGSLPLGIESGVRYADARENLAPGDVLLLYTDGVTEARSPGGELFGLERLDDVLRSCDAGAGELIGCLLEAVHHFTDGRAPGDDRTLLAAKVR
jgi:sigma-B regulation protein RsbU (phosphoserine phosphatase)